MSSLTLKLNEVCRRVRHPRDYTVADWMMLSTIGLAISAILIGATA